MAMRGPKATAKVMIASVWSVIGTGQNGTCTLAASVISAAPTMTVNAVRVDIAMRPSTGEAVVSLICASSP